MLKPQAGATRDLVNLDGVWRFALDIPDREGAPWTGALAASLEAAVPASYNDLFVDPSIRNHVGVVWYQRTVQVPRGWAGERVVLRVDAATHAGQVYVNDTIVATHVGGYTPFEADITGLAEAGGSFRLTIGVDNRLTNVTMPPGTVTTGADGKQKQTYLHDFYNYSGLARSVWLYSTPITHVTDITVTTDVAGTTGIVNYAVETVGAGEVRVRVTDAAGSTVLAVAGQTS